MYLFIGMFLVGVDVFGMSSVRISLFATHVLLDLCCCVLFSYLPKFLVGIGFCCMHMHLFISWPAEHSIHGWARSCVAKASLQ